MATQPAVGSLAPDFTLPGYVDGGKRDFTLSAERGHPVVLAFYPGDETAVCTKQLCSYSAPENWEALTGTGAMVWGISPQDVDSHESFANNRNLSMPLLADTGLAVASTYGVGDKFLRRSIFIVDADGKIAWSHVALLGVTFRSTEEIVKQLAKLPAGA